MSKRPTAKEDNIAFGARLQAARRVAALSPREVADALKVDVTDYHDWESGGSLPPSAGLYRELCDSLDVTVAWLFFGEPDGLPQETYEKLKASLT